MKSFLFITFLSLFGIANAQVGIGTTTPLGALDVTSTNNGFLVPRVSLTVGVNNASPLTSPTTSEIIYNSNNLVAPRGFYFWNGTTWIPFLTGSLTGWSTTGNTGIVDGTNFIGTTTDANIPFRRNNLHAGRIAASSTSFGLNALTSGATTNCTAIGNNALAVNTGSNNVAVGQNALAANNTPSDNTALGYNALSINTFNAGGGNRNTAVGSGALAALNGGVGNTAVGYNALNASATVSLYNTAVGAGALSGINNAAARDNVAVGYNAMTQSGVITNSVAIGSNALFSASNNSTRNTAIGFSAGSNITSGTDNIVIGANAQVPSATGTNQVQMGGTTITYAGIQVGWTVTSDQKWKNNINDSSLGLDFLNTLRPVSYIRNNDEKQRIEYGFIAQELDAAFKSAGVLNNGVISKDDNGMLGVRYNDFISITVKAIQEQQLQIEALQKKNEELMKMNEMIVKRLEALEKK